MKWWIGCSGFHYPEWKELFYPKGLAQKNWFTYYCQHFNTLELNMTFYRFPQLKFLKDWYDKSPEEFNFSLKVPRAITHYKKFNDTERMLADFYGTVKEGLQDKAGCVLFQLPKQITYNDQWLYRIIKSTNTEFNNVVEFRHPSWWRNDVYQELSKNKITFCNTSYPGLPEEMINNTSVLYYRLHGREKLYYSSYSVEKLQALVKEAKSKKMAKQAFFYFDNTAEGHAVTNAKEFQHLINK